jgi:hypothetical protein
MATETTPYISRNPGDLITAEDWNDLQIKIKEDIAKRVQEGVDGVDNVPNADNAHKLENQTPEELTNDILEKARQELPKRTGYRMLFKRLTVDEQSVIKHDLCMPPLVDVYQLDYFKVVCSADEEKHRAWVNFYLYHTSEKKIRFTPPSSGATEIIDIEPREGPPYRIPFKDMLSLYDVQYTATSSLEDLVTEFWDKLFTEPNDEFDERQYCVSPWFAKCCGDHRTVGDLKKHGDWDELWFQIRPRKTINYDGLSTTTIDPPVMPSVAPTQIQVVHFDFETLGIELLKNPVYPADQLPDPADGTTTSEGLEAIAANELKVMVLLKV